jgi:hypothetical protein
MNPQFSAVHLINSQSPHHRGGPSTRYVDYQTAMMILQSPHHRGSRSTHRHDLQAAHRPSVPLSPGKSLNCFLRPKRAATCFSPLFIGEVPQRTALQRSVVCSFAFSPLIIGEVPQRDGWLHWRVERHLASVPSSSRRSLNNPRQIADVLPSVPSSSGRSLNRLPPTGDKSPSTV